jgi:hypothetical protein
MIAAFRLLVKIPATPKSVPVHQPNCMQGDFLPARSFDDLLPLAPARNFERPAQLQERDVHRIHAKTMGVSVSCPQFNRGDSVVYGVRRERGSRRCNTCGLGVSRTQKKRGRRLSTNETLHDSFRFRGFASLDEGIQVAAVDNKPFPAPRGY